MFQLSVGFGTIATSMFQLPVGLGTIATWAVFSYIYKSGAANFCTPWTKIKGPSKVPRKKIYNNFISY